MKLDEIKSSRISKIGYDDKKALLTIVFNDGKTYEYYDVQFAVYIELLHSKSPGKYFDSSIKGKYDFERKK